MTKNKHRFIVPVIILCLAACVAKHKDYSRFEEIGAEGWPYAKNITFSIEHPDSVAYGELSLTVRHTDDYEFSNLWVEVAYDDATGNNHIDTLNIPLADTYGNWTGKGSGVWKQLETPVSKELAYRSGSIIKIRHIMRTDTLRNIDLVGIRFNEKI